MNKGSCAEDVFAHLSQQQAPKHEASFLVVWYLIYLGSVSVSWAKQIVHDLLYVHNTRPKYHSWLIRFMAQESFIHTQLFFFSWRFPSLATVFAKFRCSLLLTMSWGLNCQVFVSSKRPEKVEKSRGKNATVKEAMLFINHNSVVFRFDTC